MKYTAYLTKNSAWPLVSIKSMLIIIIDVIVFPAPAPHPGGPVGAAERVARKAAGQCPARGTGGMRVWPGLAVCILLLALPRAPQAVQTRAGRPRRTPKEQPWERLAVHSARLEEVALVCFPAAPGASFPLRVCFTSQQLSAVEGWPPSGAGPWSP